MHIAFQHYPALPRYRVPPVVETSPIHNRSSTVQDFSASQSLGEYLVLATSAEPSGQVTYNWPVVYAGNSDLWRGDFNGRTVAIKSLRARDRTHDLGRRIEIFRREVALWRQLLHPNIVPPLGLSDLGDGALPALVSPWLENGNIDQYLRNSPEHVDRLQLMVSIAEGLSYLHSQDIVHSDIKPTNILINHNGRACLADFGLSKILDSGYGATTATGALGSTRYQAPELVLGDVQHATRACDVYSFSAVCYEVLSGIQPFASLGTVVDIVLAHYEKGQPFSNANKRLFDSPSADGALWGLLSSGWNWFPYKRPNMNQVHDALSAIQGKSGSPLRQTRL